MVTKISLNDNIYLMVVLLYTVACKQKLLHALHCDYNNTLYYTD